jgi:hypothetical protein
MPYQTNQEPIDFLLHTATPAALSKKWKINLNYEPSITSGGGISSSQSITQNIEKAIEKMSFPSIVKSKTFMDSPSESLLPNSKLEPHLSRMINESGQKLSCFKIPLKFNSSSPSMSTSSQYQQNQSQQQQHASESIRYSYSIVFSIRFDDNLINFSKSYG